MKTWKRNGSIDFLPLNNVCGIVPVTLICETVYGMRVYV